ncbi:extracellular solute-binding protein family 5 [Parafrankia sp. EAN1pec]|uniref:ABC transporter substrate-binding protein n=1 Tax=Parafrankia sp. (strain EAN1pec) TaxID=298653 RepID=UPI0000544C0C|nr:extracellular solute-binding protein family 5 [Frankia sp. EAN1pec]
MIPKVRLLVTAAVCCATLALGACGGGGDTGPSSGASGEPVAGGEGRILTLSDPRSLDPAALGNAYATTGVVGNALYGTLMTDPGGKIRYSMAESFQTTDAGATFELKLRSGLVFSDGTSLDAEAVKFNWDRLKNPATAAISRSEASMIASSDVVDDTTLKITMATPVPKYAQAVLTSSLNWIASPTALEKGPQAFDANPIGAGPFTLRSWTRQAAMELVKNPRYWDAPKPYLDRLTLRAALDSSQRYNTVLTGGADAAVESSWVNLDKAEQAGLPTNLIPTGGGIFMALNTRRAPFDDVRARQALAAAIDRDALNQAVYSGTGEPVDTLFSKDSPYYSDTPLATTDRARAQRLLDELAADGKPLSFVFSSVPTTDGKAIAENIQAQLSSFKNVTVKIKTIEVAELAALRTTHDFDVLVSSAFFRDPEPRLWTTFHGTSAANLPGINDPALNESLAAARTATSEPERESAYGTLQERLAELTPVVFLAQAAPSAFSSKNVGGLVQYGLGSLQPEELWIQR